MSVSESAPASPPAALASVRWARSKLFAVSLVCSLVIFVFADYCYSKLLTQTTTTGGSHGLCFSRDPIRAFGFQPNCECIRPWLGSAYEFKTNSLGFRDKEIREVSIDSTRPRILVLGDSAAEGMTNWDDSIVGRLAAAFPEYEFLNGSVEGYSPSNYLNVVRMLDRKRVHFDEVLVFADISDAQDEAAFFHDRDATGAVATAKGKSEKTSSYSRARLWISDNLLLTSDLIQYAERASVAVGWYHLELGHGGDEFDLERSAWTYRKVSDTTGYETGYAPLGLSGGLKKEISKMDTLYGEINQRGIPISIVVYPWPAQLAHDHENSQQVQMWQNWCQGKCKRFIDLFPRFFSEKNQCPRYLPGCWYADDFVFGDTHYNSKGESIAAAQIENSFRATPVEKAQPVNVQGQLEPDKNTAH